MLTEAVKTKIRLAVEAQRQPKRGKKSGDYILRFGGGGYKVLLKDSALTEAGEYARSLGLEPIFDPEFVPKEQGARSLQLWCQSDCWWS